MLNSDLLDTLLLLETAQTLSAPKYRKTLKLKHQNFILFFIDGLNFKKAPTH